MNTWLLSRVASVCATAAVGRAALEGADSCERLAHPATAIAVARRAAKELKILMRHRL
jgi:hypothetical protein